MKPTDFVADWHPAMLAVRDWIDDEAERISPKAASLMCSLTVQLNEQLCRRSEERERLPRRTGRKEDMSPADSLELLREEDGDWIITIYKRDCTGHVINEAHVQFCTPGSGGGGSPQTFRALNALAIAMAADNAAPRSGNRALPTDH